MEQILSILTLDNGYISATDFSASVFLMALESAGIPIPSEVIMPFGIFGCWRSVSLVVAIVGALGNVVGSLVAYYIGLYSGRPLVEKYGKYILLSKHDLDKTDHWFHLRGGNGVCRSYLPIVRTYISFPAGIAKMKIVPFVIYTFVGAFI